MSISGQKITDAEIAAAGVESQPNKLTGTAQQNKAVFDALIKNLVKVRLNALIDELVGANAAGQLGIDTIGAMTATNVQAALEELYNDLASASAANLTDGSVKTNHLDTGAVTEAKIGSGAVTEGKIGTGAVTENKLGALAVTTAKIALLAITTALLADGAVTTDKLGDLAVKTGKIDNGAVDNTKLGTGAVIASKLGSDILPQHVGIKMGTAVPTTDDISPGQIYLRYE